MLRHREIIKRFQINALVAVVCEIHQVLRQGLRVAGNVDDLRHAIGNDLVQCFWLDADTRRVNNDHIRFLFHVSECLKDIARQKITICQTIERRVLFRRFHGFFYQLDAQHLFGLEREDLADRTGTAVKVEGGFALE